MLNVGNFYFISVKLFPGGECCNVFLNHRIELIQLKLGWKIRKFSVQYIVDFEIISYAWKTICIGFIVIVSEMGAGLKNNFICASCYIMDKIIRLPRVKLTWWHIINHFIADMFSSKMSSC